MNACFFIAKLFTKLELLEFISLMNKRVMEYGAGRNSQRAACNWQRIKEKFSVLMEAPQSKLEEHSGKILLMKEMNN